MITGLVAFGVIDGGKGLGKTIRVECANIDGEYPRLRLFEVDTLSPFSNATRYIDLNLDTFETIATLLKIAKEQAHD